MGGLFQVGAHAIYKVNDEVPVYVIPVYYMLKAVEYRVQAYFTVYRFPCFFYKFREQGSLVIVVERIHYFISKAHESIYSIYRIMQLLIQAMDA